METNIFSVLEKEYNLSPANLNPQWQSRNDKDDIGSCSIVDGLLHLISRPAIGVRAEGPCIES